MSLRAFYDPTRDRIFGAKKGTMAYFHEEGHRKGWKTGLDPECQMWAGYFLFGSVALLSIGALEISRLTMVLLLLFLLIPEVHAWLFAFRKWKESR